MGLGVVGLGVLGLGLLFAIYTSVFLDDANMVTSVTDVMTIITGFSFGASSIALFARVGGGIYTKAADVGADLVGKVEAGIPEDDPRNPGVIADNVGDNVGDVAGMGSDIFESYCNSMIASIAIASTMALSATEALGGQMAMMNLPLAMTSLGLLCSIGGILIVKMNSAKSPEKALRTGTIGSPACSLSNTSSARLES